MNDPLVHDLVDRSYVFVDDSMIAASVGVERRVHPMIRHGDGPVLQTTEPWEAALTDPISVIFDAQLGLWRMWYCSYGDRQTPLPGIRGGSLHLAVSEDGIQWRKDPLNVFSINGDTRNNLCVWEDGSVVDGPRAIFDDINETDPTKRFKLIRYAPSYYLAYSADGIRWRSAQDQPVWANGCGDGLEETSFFFRDPMANRYRGYMRVWRRNQTHRLNGMGESDDLRLWTGPKICFDAQPHYGIGAQVYGMHVHVDSGLYWGLPWIFFTHEPLDEDLQQTIRLRLAWSRDGVAWNPMAPDQDILPMGRRNVDFDWGMVIPHCPTVTRGSENFLYYCGMNGIHTHEGQPKLRAVGLARWRQGGLVGMAADGLGTLLTRRFVMRGREIRINAKTLHQAYPGAAGGGRIVAELISDQGNIINNHSFATSDPFTGDDTDHALTWSGQSDLRHLAGQYVMLRLRMERAELFSFRMAGTPDDFRASQGPPPVRAGRCVQPPVIDGILNDECWQDFNHTGVAGEFVEFTAVKPAPVRTRALFTHDDKNLYIAVECEEPHTDKLPADRKPGPVRYRKEECIEIRLGAPHHGTFVHQFLITSTGAGDHNWFSKEAGGLHPNYPGEWTIKPHVVPGRWMVEVAIPFATLTSEAPVPGDLWKLNIIRYRSMDGEQCSCWSCMFGSVHRNDLAGTLAFV